MDVPATPAMGTPAAPEKTAPLVVPAAPPEEDSESVLAPDTEGKPAATPALDPQSHTSLVPTIKVAVCTLVRVGLAWKYTRIAVSAA